MKVQERTFAKLVNGKSTFVIPAFQRRYSWRKNNFSQLWDDITQVIEGVRKHHFMGTLVLQPEENSNIAVIDGQQRLATFTIILKVLHVLSYEFAKDSTRSIQKYLTRDGAAVFKPSFRDQDAFKDLLSNPLMLERSRVKECYEFFLEEIQTYIKSDASNKSNSFLKIYEALLSKMAFVQITLNDEDDPHAIFETINSKGEPLTAADLARNYVLSQAGQNDERKVRLDELYWKPLEKKLSDSIAGSKKVRNAELQKVLPEFIRSALIVESGKYIGSTDLFKQIRIHFRGVNSLEGKLKTILAHADEYCKLLNPAVVTPRKLALQLERLQELKMTTYNPVLLVLFRALEAGDIDNVEMQRAIQYIESFIVRRSFKGKVSRDLPAVFSRVASKLCLKAPREKYLSLLQKLLADEKWPDDVVFKQGFLQQPIYSSAKEMARFALISIERNMPNTRDISIDNKTQIEHIFPKSPRPADWPSTELAGLKMKLHVMGNLTLTNYNPELNNFGFLKKKKANPGGFQKSSYWLSKTLLRRSVWTGSEIDKRGERLFREALKIWPSV